MMKGEQCYSSIVCALVGLDSDTEKKAVKPGIKSNISLNYF